MIVLALLAALPLGAPGGPPEFLKVDPPGWWAGHSLNPVRLLIRGRGLKDAVLLGGGPSLHPGPVRTNESGTAAFADLVIDAQATPGSRSLTLSTTAGRTTFPFEILEALPRAGRFQGFSADDVLYLIMVDRFANGDPTNDDPARSPGLTDRKKGRYYHGGDLKGIEAHLPYLKNLGVTTLWLTPLYDNVDHFNERQRVQGENTTDYHGYGAVDFYAVEEHFGDVAALRSLVEAAHRSGLKVILDQIANHTGPDHPWAKDPPTPTWFNGTEAKHLVNHWQIWTLADPHASPATQKETLEGWFGDVLPDLNQNDREVARYLIQNTLWWIGIAGLDGIREDTLPYVPRSFWREWRAALKKEYPNLSVVGEVWNGDPAVVSFFQGGKPRFDGIDSGIESLFDFPLFEGLRRVFGEGEPLAYVPSILGHDRLYDDPGRLVTFFGLHDNPRFMSAATPAGLKLAETLLFTTRGIPLLYYGDEIGMAGGEDPDNRRDFPGGFPGDPRDAFLTSGRTAEEQALYAHAKRLLHLRSQLAPLRRGELRDLEVSPQTYVFSRFTREQVVLVALNNDTKPATIHLRAQDTGIPAGSSLDDQLGVIVPFLLRGETSFELPPRSGAILVPRTQGTSPSHDR